MLGFLSGLIFWRSCAFSDNGEFVVFSLLEKPDFWKIKQTYFNNKDMQGDEANKTKHWDVTDKEAAGSAVFHLTTYYYVRKLIIVWFKNKVRASLQAIAHQSSMAHILPQPLGCSCIVGWTVNEYYIS